MVDSKNDCRFGEAQSGSAASSSARVINWSQRSRARLSDGEWRVTNAQARMTALFDVGLRAAEAENEEIAEPLFRALPDPAPGTSAPECRRAGTWR